MLLFGLVGAALYGISYVHKVPEWVEEPMVTVNYQHDGQLGYLVYIQPSRLYDTYVEAPDENDEDEKTSLYFTSLIEEIDVGFSYDFVANELMAGLSSDVEVVAILNGPSGWEKEIPLHSATDLGKSFSFSFPLDLEDFDELIDEIEEELEIRYSTYEEENTYDMVIEATVVTTGNVAGKQIEDTFVQPMEIAVGRGTLKWDNNLVLSQRKSDGGFSYKQRGRFSYTLELKNNSLYDPAIDTIITEPYQWPEVSPLEPGNVYFNKIIDVMSANFDYQFFCDKAVENITEEVEVKAILEYPEVWSKTFTLVPKTQKTDKFRVDFALDINSLADFTNKMRDEIGMGAASHNLTILAEVHTIAKTDFGTINEVFSQSLEGTLTSSTLTWGEELKSSKEGSIMGTHWVPNTQRFIGLSLEDTKLAFPIVAAIIFPFAIYLLIINVAFHPLPPSKLESEAKQAKKKHKGLFVDVKELPDVKDQAITVISLGSLDDLITTAESLFKPVLHKAEEERHTYCVIDGTTRYEYVSKDLLTEKDLPNNQRSRI